jgi:hypothetical protein
MRAAVADTRMVGEMSKEEEPDPLQEARKRASEYLDLWERHVSIAAVHGKPPPAAGQPRKD